MPEVASQIPFISRLFKWLLLVTTLNWSCYWFTKIKNKKKSSSFCCRPDGHQNNLRSSAYESLMEIVKNSAKDCYPAVQKTTLVIMERLQQVLQMEVGKS